MKTTSRRFSERFLWLIVPLLLIGYWFVDRGKMTRTEFLEACRAEVLTQLESPPNAKFEWDEMVRTVRSPDGLVLRSTVKVPNRHGEMVPNKFACYEVAGVEGKVRAVLEKR